MWQYSYCQRLRNPSSHIAMCCNVLLAYCDYRINKNDKCDIWENVCGVHLQQEWTPHFGYMLQSLYLAAMIIDGLLSTYHVGTSYMSPLSISRGWGGCQSLFLYMSTSDTNALLWGPMLASPYISSWDLSSIKSMTERWNWSLVWILIWTEVPQIRPWNVWISVWWLRKAN